MAYLDARDYDGPHDIACDLCIVGAGAAGITLARMLARTGRRIILIESGGLHFDGDTQALFRGKLTGVPYFDLSSCRLRYFGGSTSHWGGFCSFPRRIDFDSRPALRMPGWPIGYDDLIGYLTEAAVLYGIDPEALTPDIPAHDGNGRVSFVDQASKSLVTGYQIQSLPRFRNFNPRFVAEVEDLPGVEVFLNANLTHIGLGENGSTLKTFTIKTLTGKTFYVRPKIGILASHAIETARLLLASNDVVPVGIGNQGDHVGRYFMDHIHVRTGRFVPNPARMPNRYFKDYIFPERMRALWQQIQVTDEVRLKNDLVHYSCEFESHYSDADEYTGQAVSRIIKGFFKPFEVQMARDVGTLLAHPLSGTASTVARFGLRQRTPEWYHLVHQIEQWPNPDSRVTLTAERDALGVPGVSLNYALGEVDYHTFQRGQEIVAKELSALDWGRFSLTELKPKYVDQNVLGVWHNMGTTRMSDSPRAGVVDRNCRVHGTDNLYIASCGNFPNATASWPTMLLTALSLRMAQHLDGGGLV